MTTRDVLDRRGQARALRRWHPTTELGRGVVPSPATSVASADRVDVEPPAIVESSGPLATSGPGDRRTIAVVRVAAVLVAIAAAGRLVDVDRRGTQPGADSVTGAVAPASTTDPATTPARVSVRSPVAGTIVRGSSVRVVLDGGSTATVVEVIVAAGATELGKVRVAISGGATKTVDVVIGSLPFALDGAIRVAPPAAGSRPIAVLPVRLEPDPVVALTGIDMAAGADGPRLEIDGVAPAELQRLSFRLEALDHAGANDGSDHGPGGGIGGAARTSDDARTVASGAILLGASGVGWGGILLPERPFRWLTDIEPLMPGTRTRLEISWTDPRTGREASIGRILVVPRGPRSAPSAGRWPPTIRSDRPDVTLPAEV